MRKLNTILLKAVFFSIIFLLNISCNAQQAVVSDNYETKNVKVDKKEKKKKRKKKYKLPKIDLNHWSVTTPERNKKGGAMNIEPPQILDYATDERLLPYMYNDSIKGALVFHAFPSKATTANTKYSRSELREQMVPGDNNTNWTFADGAYMKGKLKMEEVTKAENGKYHRVVIMQIHGRLTNEQKELIGQKDNNAPPMLKIYWQDGKIRVKTKILKDLNASGADILHKDAWGDDKGFNFEQKVDFRKFTLEVKISEGKMVIVLNKNEFKVYENIHMEKWGIFENYFKAGNYFQTRDEGAFAKVNYYNLEVKH